MAKQKKSDVYIHEKEVKEDAGKKPKGWGTPWKTASTTATFEEADAKRKLLEEKWKETGVVGAKAKVKRLRSTDRYSVKVRVLAKPAPPPPSEKTDKKEKSPGKKSKDQSKKKADRRKK